MVPALSQLCTLQAPFEADVADYAAGRCRAMEVWLGKLEAFLERHSLDDVRRLLARHEMAVPVASYQGGLLDSQGEARREHWGHFARRLELCHELGIGTLVVAADVAAPLPVGRIDNPSYAQVIDRVKVSLAEAAEQAGRHGVRLALEFQARSALGNNLQTAAALVEEIANPHFGVCLDVFHFFTGPSKTEDLGYLTPAHLFHVQLCDLAGVPRELATDADRILPGDGDLPLAPLLAHLRATGYEGCISVELMNPTLWQVPPRQFGEVAIAALNKLLDRAR
jgi:2-keto-myo-inositol isomerase